MYYDINDYELLDKVSDNEEATEMIFEKYSPLIKKIATKAYYKNNINGMEINDLIQEGMIGLSVAINTFDDSKEASFFTFARMCIIRRISSYITSFSRLKHQALNESISVEKITEENYKDKIFQDIESNPENVVILGETTREIMTKIENVLTNFECEVFELKTAGFNYKEIGELLDKDAKSINNAMTRIKNKINKLKEV